jgi:anti-anti-sigma factor
VELHGEHDISTSERLSSTLEDATRVDGGADVVVDLSDVSFMDASTIGALVVARNRLLALSRSLTVRAPSSAARRLLDLCGLDRLIDVDQTATRLPGAAALGSWVAVPAIGDKRIDPSPDTTQPLEIAAPSRSEERVHAVVHRHVERQAMTSPRRVPP